MAKSKITSNRTASSVDKHIGVRIRTRRVELGVSQTALANAIGVTFQQVQKYERGHNRVAAGTLYAIAEALHAPVTAFYPAASAPRNFAGALADTPDMAELSVNFARLDTNAQRMLLATARAFVAQAGGAPAARKRGDKA